MPDPTRHKRTFEIFVDAKAESIDHSIRFHLLADKEVIDNTPQDVLQAMIRKDLDTLSITPVSGIYKNYISFNYTEPEALKDFDFGNTLVQAHLPYCLHLPNYYEMTVKLPEHELSALVIFEKIWTSRARADHAPSDSTDLYAEDRVLYFKNSTILTPKIPFIPEEGWDSFFTGKNIERMKDQNGVFRYTLVHIQFDTPLPQQIARLGQAALETLLHAVQERALAIINRVIDIYRVTTNESHVRRLGELKVNLIYFLSQNQGFYILLPNIETAQMNRSRQEIESISAQLSGGRRPDIHTLLVLDARSSLDAGDYTLAIVESFQALEILLENYLLGILQARGDSDEQIAKFLKTNWMTKDRLTTVLKSLKGSSLNERREIWDRWCTRYDKTRNEVLHAGKEPTRKETEDTLAVNESVIHWLLSL